MKILLDTHILLWAADSPQRLPPRARKLMSDPQHQLVFSAASIWEIAIKQGLGRTSFKADARLLRRGLLDNGYTELPVDGNHAAAVANLVPIHHDPFDRLLIAQATVEGITLLSADPLVLRYPGPIKRA